MRFTADFCTWSRAACFYDMIVDFSLCNKMIPTIKTISVQVFYSFLREFCRGWHALDKCTTQPRAPMQGRVASHEKALHTCSNQAKTDWEARALGHTPSAL